MTEISTRERQNGSPLQESDVVEHMRGRPATVTRIARFLFRTYEPYVDIGDLVSRPKSDQIDHLLTRSLAAHAVLANVSVDKPEAAKAVVDGGQDLGIDAIALDEQQKTCWIIQSKFVKGGQGEVSWTDVQKFLDGFTSIVSDSFEHANSKILAMKDDISRAVASPSWRFKLVLATTSTKPLSERNLQEIREKLERDYALGKAANYLNQ